MARGGGGGGPAAVAWRAALEVVDSVWQDYRFDWALNTADGSSAAFVVLGDVIDEADLAGSSVELRRNGEVVGRGSGGAAMDDPWLALAWLALARLVDRLAERDQALQPGGVVITGGLTAAVPLEPGDAVTATVGRASAGVSRAR